MNLEKQTCPACGAPTSQLGQLCPACDARQRDIFANPQNNQGSTNRPYAGDSNRWIVTLLLCWFLGTLGVHRFYTGHVAIGIAQLLTGGGCLVWWLIDLIMILTSNFKDSEGNVIKN